MYYLVITELVQQHHHPQHSVLHIQLIAKVKSHYGSHQTTKILSSLFSIILPTFQNSLTEQINDLQCDLLIIC